MMLLIIGAGFYLWRRKHKQTPQGTKLVYDADDNDTIQKFKDPITGNFFAYGSEAGRRMFHNIAKGKKAGEIVEIPVVFKKGGAKLIHATVADDGESFQAMEAYNTTNSDWKKSEFLCQKAYLESRITKHTFNLGLYKAEIWNQKTSEIVPLDLGSDKNYDLVLEAVQAAPETASDRPVGNVTSDGVLQTYELKNVVKEQPQAPRVRSDLTEVKQAFKNISHGRHVYAVFDVGKFICNVDLIAVNGEDGERAGTAMWYPAHYLKMCPLYHGKTYQLHNCQKVEASQSFVWNENNIQKIEGQDMVLHRLDRPYSHLACITKIRILKDGEHDLWFHGIDPKTQKPMMSFLKGCLKRGNKIKYKMPNCPGLCAGTLMLDSDQTIIVGQHISGDEVLSCTAEAVSPAFVQATGINLIKDQAF